MVDNVIDLAPYRRRRMERDLEKEIIGRLGNGVPLLADAFGLLRKDLRSVDRVQDVLDRALVHVGYHPVSRDGWLALGTTQLLKGNLEGLESLKNGINDYEPEAFPLRYARYAIERTLIPPQRDEALKELEDLFTDGA